MVVLRHLHGYSNREIAAAVGAPESTVSSRLNTAKARLAAELVAAGIEPPQPPVVAESLSGVSMSRMSTEVRRGR